MKFSSFFLLFEKGSHNFSLIFPPFNKTKRALLFRENGKVEGSFAQYFF